MTSAHSAETGRCTNLYWIKQWLCGVVCVYVCVGTGEWCKWIFCSVQNWWTGQDPKQRDRNHQGAVKKKEALFAYLNNTKRNYTDANSALCCSSPYFSYFQPIIMHRGGVETEINHILLYHKWTNSTIRMRCTPQYISHAHKERIQCGRAFTLKNIACRFESIEVVFVHMLWLIFSLSGFVFGLWVSLCLLWSCISSE